MSGLIDKITVLGRDFTIQTEYIPGENAKVRTLVYDGGRLVTSREIALGGDTGGSIDDNVHEQHQRITQTLISRANELKAAKSSARKTPAPKTTTTPEPSPKARKTARPVVEPGSRLETAIAIRQTIGPFGLAFAGPAPTTTEGYARTLDAAETTIDAIRDAPTYGSIRLDEQLTMIALKSQFQTWHGADRDIGMAIDIWATVESFAFHLQKINNRSDLVAFDHQTLTWAMSELGKGKITEEMLVALTGLGGRDAELDELIRHPEGAQPFDLLEILLRLMDQTLA